MARWRPSPLPMLLLLTALLLCLPARAGSSGEEDLGGGVGLLPGAAVATAEGAQPKVEVPKAGGVIEDLLHWGIQNSDPARLQELIRKYQEKNLTLKDVYGQEVIDAMFIDESAAIRQLIGDIKEFRNATVADEDVEAALDRLEEFVEQIDNAGNLHRMGGLAPLLDLGLLEGAERGPEVRAKALLVLGVATQNNPPVQEDVLTLEGLGRLAARLPRCSPGDVDGGGDAGGDSAAFCGKLLFAASALVKNNASIQAQASDVGIFDWMMGPGIAHPSLAVAKKAMGTLETVLAQSPELPLLAKLSASTAMQASVADTLLAHIRGKTSAEESDTDAPEKALRLVGRLLAIRPMLFPAAFQPALAAAAAEARARCERAFAAGDELCEALVGLAALADLALTARDIGDDEL